MVSQQKLSVSDARHSNISSVVDGQVSADGIANMFASRYSDLYRLLVYRMTMKICSILEMSLICL